MSTMTAMRTGIMPTMPMVGRRLDIFLTDKRSSASETRCLKIQEEYAVPAGEYVTRCDLGAVQALLFTC